MVINKTIDDLSTLGYERVIFRGDQEPALGAFMAMVRQAWPGDVVPELAPTGESQANGLAERAIQTVEGDG